MSDKDKTKVQNRKLHPNNLDNTNLLADNQGGRSVTDKGFLLDNLVRVIHASKYIQKIKTSHKSISLF